MAAKATTRPTSVAASYLGDYVEVKDRIKPFWELYPNGRIENEVIEISDTRVTVKCSIFADRADEFPISVGHSWMNVPGATNFTRGSEVENTETSAVGRALAFIGIGIDKSIASANEIVGKANTTKAIAPPLKTVDPNAATPDQKQEMRRLAEIVYDKDWQNGLLLDYGVASSASLTKETADIINADLAVEALNVS